MPFFQAANVTVLQSRRVPACNLANAIDLPQSNLRVRVSEIGPRLRLQQLSSLHKLAALLLDG